MVKAEVTHPLLEEVWSARPYSTSLSPPFPLVRSSQMCDHISRFKLVPGRHLTKAKEAVTHPVCEEGEKVWSGGAQYVWF